MTAAKINPVEVSVNRVAKTMTGAGVSILATACFCAAMVIDRETQVPPAPVPNASDVRATVEFATTGLALVSTAEPIGLTLPQNWLDGLHRLVGHAKANLAVDGQIGNGGLRLRLSKKLMPHGWINLGAQFDQVRDGGTPALSFYIGNWRLPDRATALLLKIGLPIVDKGGPQHDSLNDLIPRFQVMDQKVQMTARVPKNLIGGLQAVIGSGGGARIDLDQARGFYGDLLAYHLLHPDHDYPRIVQHVAKQVQDQDDLKAALVALTLLTDGLRVRRLAGERTATPPCPLEAQTVYLHGRSDLPKHWTVSAALALFMDKRPARAAGLWKELDDSLPGGDGVPAGTGFSFVDLGADMAGVAVGMAARNGKDVDQVIAALRSGKGEVLLPAAVLNLPEGIPLAAFERRYGQLEQPRMLHEEGRIQRLLTPSPLYRSLLSEKP